ncbi:hypothetical protein ABZ351_34775 [Streptomyces microflavus]|uniref:hypothetical protein n=1 Tax=Streptomyces microflavus TaxID=1919 RepID=UPI0033D9EBF1
MKEINRTVLQCTAVTETPYDEAFDALTDMKGGPNDPDVHLAFKAFLLCELGEHTDDTQHAALLWIAEEPAESLWFLWTMGGAHIISHQFATLTMCPARLIDVPTGARDWCNYFEGHRPHDHSFHVTDPLRDLIRERARHEAQQLISEDDADDSRDEC